MEVVEHRLTALALLGNEMAKGATINRIR